MRVYRVMVLGLFFVGLISSLFILYALVSRPCFVPCGKFAFFAQGQEITVAAQGNFTHVVGRISVTQWYSDGSLISHDTGFYLYVGRSIFVLFGTGQWRSIKTMYHTNGTPILLLDNNDIMYALVPVND